VRNVHIALNGKSGVKPARYPPLWRRADCICHCIREGAIKWWIEVRKPAFF